MLGLLLYIRENNKVYYEGVEDTRLNVVNSKPTERSDV